MLSKYRRLEVVELERRELLAVLFQPAIEVAGAASTAQPAGYSPAQIQNAYGFNEINNDGAAGSGQTIAIVVAYDDPTIASDLHAFDLAYGLPDAPSFSKVNQSGGAAMPSPNSQWALESALDVEWAHAMAPAANLVLVEANSPGLSDLLTATQTAASLPGVSVVSMSWGTGEFAGETQFDSYFTTPSGHANVVFVASAGDTSGYLQYPSVAPTVVSVGGTQLNLDSAGDVLSEVSWTNSGGGISAYEPQPDFQQGVVVQSNSNRVGPDVAYDADPTTGYSVYDSYGVSAATPWSTVGGTSAGAPQLSALFAIMDQARANQGQQPLSSTQALSFLYDTPAHDLRDITVNGPGTFGWPFGYPVGPGYDMQTGLGTPLANRLVYDLTNVTALPYHFKLYTPQNTTPGQAFTFTLSVRDAFNQPVTSYAGTVQFTSSDPNFTPFSYTFKPSDQGSVTLTTTLDGSLTATDGQTTVTASVPTKLLHFVTSLPTQMTAGVTTTFTVMAYNSNGNFDPNYNGTVGFIIPNAADSYYFPNLGTIVNGVGTFTGTFYFEGVKSITISDGYLATTTQNITVVPGPLNHLQLAGTVQGTTAGVPLSYVNVTALDAYNNVLTNYNGTITLTSTDPQATLPPSFSLVNGTATFSNAIVFKTAGPQTLTATASNGISQALSIPNVSPGAPATFVISNPSSLTVGQAANFTVTVEDAYGNVDTNFTGTVTFSSSDARAQLPATYTYTAADQGVHTFSMTLNTDGQQTVTLSDSSVPNAITGTAAVTVTSSPPTIVDPAVANPGTVTGVSTSLSALGAGVLGQSSLTYTWVATSIPVGAAAPTFSSNGVNASQNTTATFSMAGNYTFQVAVTDPNNQSVVSSVNVMVTQTATSLTLSPTSATVLDGGSQQFSATALDQFGSPMSAALSLASSSVGTLSSTGLYTAPAAGAGTATIIASAGKLSSSATVNVLVPGPSVVTPAAATPNLVTGTSTGLSVVGADPTGASSLIYTWKVIGTPSGATAPSFSSNGTNAAQNTTATFYQAGSYSFLVTVTDAAGLTASSSVSVIVSQTAASLTLTPATTTVLDGGSQQFSATALDQFGNAMSTTWTLASGSVGSLSSTGLYAAPASGAGTATVIANAGSLTSDATVTVLIPGPSIVTPAATTANPVTGTTANLSVLGADPTGAAGLTYIWKVTSSPSGATAPSFSSNGTNAAQNTTATFYEAGAYTFLVTVTDATGLTASSSISVMVSQTAASLMLTPSNTTILDGNSQQFSATALDQFGNAMSTTWALASGSVGSLSSTGLYSAPASGAGTATVIASAGALTSSATVTVLIPGPSIVTPAATAANPVTGTTANLSVLGADPTGAAGLTYTWSVSSFPSGAAVPTFSINGTNAAQNTTVTFYQAGAYTFLVTVKDPAGLTVTSNVNVTVNQTAKGLTLTPATVTVLDGGSQQFTASAKDQFGNAMSTTWSLASSSVGTLSGTGLYSAPASGAGTATVAVSAGAMASSAAVTVVIPGPSVVTAAKSNFSPVTGTTASLSVLGADPTGASGLTYTWSVTGSPSGAALPTFSANGTNAAQNSTATFYQAGTYTLLATLKDPAGLTATSSVTLAVNQTLTSISVSPGNVALAVNGQQQFQVTGFDQFGQKMALPASSGLAWAVAAGGIGSISSSGLYQAPSSAVGSATVRATVGNIASTATVTINASAPVITQAASAAQNSVSGTQTQLQVQASDPQGSNLTYTWSVASQPNGATTPSLNSANSNSTKVTFFQAGSYTFTVTVKNTYGLSTTSSVAVTVVQTLTGLSVTPGNVTLAAGATQQFTAAAVDQFGKPMSSTPAYSWHVSGGGTISSSGLYTASANQAGNFQVTVSASGVSAQASVTVMTAPAAPTNLSASVNWQHGVESVQLQWNNNSNNETGFYIQRSSNGGRTWTTIAVLNGNANSYTDTSISWLNNYSYRVFAYNPIGDSPYSNVTNVWT